nr:hypothetical protein [uncultured bacterium]
MLMKLVAHGDDRPAALARMAAALEDCVVEGVRTTLPFLSRVVKHPAFVRGSVHTQMVEQGAFNA